MAKPTLSERFWSKVNIAGPDDCWEWTGTIRTGGYGHFSMNGGRKSAHRVSYLLAHGSWPDPCCLHACDNPPCVNPAHLSQGTKPENNTQRSERGRNGWKSHHGEANGRARLNAAQVVEIRKTWDAGGSTLRAIADEYGVSQPCIESVVYRHNWKHIP